MDLPADVAEQPLDRGVDVLVLGTLVAPSTAASSASRVLRLRELGVVEQPGGVEPARVQRGRLAVVREQLGVVRAQERG